MEKVHWVLEKNLLKRNRERGISQLDKAVIATGHNLHIINYNITERSFDEWPAIPNFEPVIFHGPIGAFRVFSRDAANLGWHPIGYCNFDQLSYTEFSSHVLDDLLNKSHHYMTWGAFEQQIREDPNGYFDKNKSVFIRPNKVTKTFPATVLNIHNYNIELRTIGYYMAVPDSTLIVVCPSKILDKEYRIIIGNKKVITGSQYSNGSKSEISSIVPDDILELADKVSKLDWQPDIVYTCDIGYELGIDIPKIIEFNSFSCAGLYACDLEKAVREISEITNG